MHHFVIASALDDACRPALRLALQVAAGALATVDMLVVQDPRGGAAPLEPHGVREWLLADPDLGAAANWRLTVVRGLPEIEVGRFAERAGAQLVIATRCVGEAGGREADALLRRATLPTLLLPCAPLGSGPMLVALDATPRGFQVHQVAEALAHLLGRELAAVTVDPPEPGAAAGGGVMLHSARTGALLSRLATTSIGSARVRSGSVVPEVLAEVDELGASVLAIGLRRLGRGGEIPETSIARQLAFRARCAVLAIPI